MGLVRHGGPSLVREGRITDFRGGNLGCEHLGGCLGRRGKIESDLGSEATVRDWLARYPLTAIPPDMEIALLSRTLPFDHEDPADRFIAATTHRLGVPLATSDGRLLNLGWLRTLT